MTWLQPLFYRWVKWYYRKPRWISKRGIQMHLLPTVFHPSIYISTDVFLDFFLSLGTEGASVLELGTGNGFIAMYLTKFKHCTVTASDINPAAIRGLEESCARNKIKLTAVCSDLFDKVPSSRFDYILVNPPYYNRDVKSVDEHAFYCGANFEYFTKFFTQIASQLKQDAKVFIILSDSAQLGSISEIAQRLGIKMNVVLQQNNRTEVFYIYELEQAKSFAKNNIE